MKIPKCFWFHDWDKWREIERGIIQRNNAEKSNIGNYTVQERTCKSCNLKELRHQKLNIV